MIRKANIFLCFLLQNLLPLFRSVNLVRQQKNWPINTPNIYLLLQINMIAEESYSLFVDNSGSVGNCTHYWETVNNILAEYAKDITHYYFWNSNCTTYTKKDFMKWVETKRGTGGTSPEYVAAEIAKSKHSNIILVTDGEVGDHSVSQCDNILEEVKQKQGFKIKKAVCYVIGSYSEPNLSVTCPFSRFSESKVFSRMGGNPLKAVISYTSEDYKILDELQEISLENFEAKYETIEALIIAQNMGKDCNLPLKNQLVSMKTRLVKELSKSLGKKDFNQQLREKLEAKQLKESLEMVKNMATKYFEVSGTGELEKKILYLISLCGDMRGQYSLGQIKSNKMATAQTAVTGQVDKNQDLTDLSKNPIECPIIMDEDVPQILVDECEPFLLGVEKFIVDDINACPLRLLNYPDLKKKFKARLSNFTGVKFCDKLLKNPYTQNRLLGAIPLGTHKSHMTVGNHTIAKMVSGGKVMGNLNMYYAVLWIIVHEDEIEYLKPIKANLTEHLLFRLKSTQTMASMCGLSQFVSTQVSTDLALWYVVNSGFLNNPVEKDTFRFHLYNLQHMAKLVEVLDYPVDEGFQRHYLRTKALYFFMDKYKKSSKAQKTTMMNLFKGLNQKGFFVDTANLDKKFKESEVCSEFILVDGPADNAQKMAVRSKFPSFCQGLTDSDLIYVAALIDDHKQSEEIFMDYNVVVPDLPQPQVNWKYGQSEYDHKVSVSPVTGHPLTHHFGRSWQEQAKEVFGFSDKKDLFNGCKYIQEFLLKHKKKPTKDELAVFYYNRYVQSGKKNTLPHLTQQWIQQLLAAYENVLPEGGDIKAVIKAIKANRDPKLRVQLEV